MKPLLRWASLLAGVAALWLSYRHIGAPYITNDGYQYLDAASNLAAAECLCTRVALFDEQVAFGRMPVPFTHFPPAYPLLMAAISRTGLSLEEAGYLLSALGFLAVLWFLWDIGLTLDARPWLLALFSLLWITHATALLYAATVGTESLFTALLLGLAALIVRDTRESGSGGNQAVLLPLIGVVAGFSYSIRYAGLFLVGAAGVYLVYRMWRTPRAWQSAALGLAAAGLLTGSVQVRNSIYTGSWRGGFSNGGHQTLRAIITDTTLAWIHLVIGDRVPIHADPWLAILAASAVFVVYSFIRVCFQKESPVRDIARPLIWIAFIAAAYMGGVMLAAFTTIARDFPRYYFPLYPLFLVGAAVACSLIAKGMKAWAAPIFVLSVIAIEQRSLFVAPPQPDWIVARGILTEDVHPGLQMLQWLRGHMTPADVMVAVDGQAVHYVLGRPVVAVLPPGDTRRRTDGAGFQSLMHQYHSRYLMVLLNAPPTRDPEQDATPFLRELAAGRTPVWLHLAEQTPHAAIYECPDCAS